MQRDPTKTAGMRVYKLNDETESVSEATARQNQASAGSISASVVVPYNEVESLPDLISAIATTLTCQVKLRDYLCR